MISSRSSRAAYAVAAAGVVLVAGCGGSSSTPSAASSKASSGAASSSASSSSSASPSSVADGAAIDSTATVTPIVAAITAAKSGHAVLSGAAIATEDFALAKGVKGTVSSGGLKLEVLQVGSITYLKGMPGTGSKWLKIDPKGTSPMDKAMSSMGDLSKGSDPSTTLRLLADAKGTKVGSETVAGKATTRYHFVVPPSSYAKAMGAGALASALKEPVALDLWVAADNLPVKSTSSVTVSGRTVTTGVAYSDWGKPVDITAPPASQVTTSVPGGGSAL